MYFGPCLTSADLPSQVNKNQYCSDAHAVRKFLSTFSRCEGTSQIGMETTRKLSQLPRYLSELLTFVKTILYLITILRLPLRRGIQVCSKYQWVRGLASLRNETRFELTGW